MRKSSVSLAIVLVTGLCLGCDMLSGDSEASANSASGKAGDEDTSFVTSLLDRARDLLPDSQADAKGGAAAPNSAVARSGGDPAAIVRCEVEGRVTFTRASQCDNLGGYGVPMALKGKNSAP